MKDEIELNDGHIPKYYLENEKYINKSVKKD